MNIKVRRLEPGDVNAWDAYAHSHPQGTLYHLSCWRKVIQNTYGHKTYYLMACEKKSCNVIDNVQKNVTCGLPEMLSRGTQATGSPTTSCSISSAIPIITPTPAGDTSCSGISMKAPSYPPATQAWYS